MKKLLIIFVSLIITGTAYGQTLSFSAVVNLSDNCAGGSHVIDTVPAGKVWKIENMALTDTYIELQIPGSSSVRLTQWDFTYPWLPPGATQQNTAGKAFWLAEGKVLQAVCVDQNDRYFISILEFDVGP